METDYSAPLTATELIVELASGAYCFANKIKASQVKQLWEKLSVWIAEMLTKQQKGVLLPNLGNFRVGPVVGEARKKIRPIFALLDGRYGAVSQERPRYNIGGRAAIIQPNYGLLSTASAIHRGATQRLVAELLQRLGVHILSGRPLRVDFPGLGKMMTNKAGRFEFVFDTLIMEFFEREQFALVREMESGPEEQVVKALQHVNLEDPPYIKSPASRPASGMPRPASRNVRPVSAATGVTAPRQRPVSAAHAPYKGPLLELWKLCKGADRTGAGTVPRLSLEGWLQREVRPLLTQVDGATMLDLLTAYTFGKTSKLIIYKPFLDALERVLTPVSPRAASPGARGRQDSASLDGQGSPRGQDGSDPYEQGMHLNEEASMQDLVEGADGPYEDGGGAYMQQQQQPGQGYVQQGYAPQAPGQGYMQQGQGQYPHRMHAPPQLQLPAEDPQPQDYIHYAQHKLSPRSRADFDEFNRMHFDKLTQMRGPTPKRAVTPKVGEDPLNLQEYQAVRYTRTPQQQPMQAWAPPPSQPQPQQGNAGARALPPRVPPGYSVAPSTIPSPLLPHQMSPRGYNVRNASPQPQVFKVMHDPQPGRQTPAAYAPYATTDSAAVEQGRREGRAPAPYTPVSQYDIINEEDPRKRGQLKAMLAEQLQQGWNRQIEEKTEYERSVNTAEGQWPFGLVGMPNDKRPFSAVSRPYTSPRRARPGSPGR